MIVVEFDKNSKTKVLFFQNIYIYYQIKNFVIYPWESFKKTEFDYFYHHRRYHNLWVSIRHPVYIKCLHLCPMYIIYTYIHNYILCLIMYLRLRGVFPFFISQIYRGEKVSKIKEVIIYKPLHIKITFNYKIDVSNSQLKCGFEYLLQNIDTRGVFPLHL